MNCPADDDDEVIRKIVSRVKRRIELQNQRRIKLQKPKRNFNNRSSFRWPDEFDIEIDPGPDYPLDFDDDKLYWERIKQAVRASVDKSLVRPKAPKKVITEEIKCLKRSRQLLTATRILLRKPNDQKAALRALKLAQEE